MKNFIITVCGWVGLIPRYCAWCGKFEGVKLAHGGSSGPTHGICPACFASQVAHLRSGVMHG